MMGGQVFVGGGVVILWIHVLWFAKIGAYSLLQLPEIKFAEFPSADQQNDFTLFFNLWKMKDPLGSQI